MPLSGGPISCKPPASAARLMIAQGRAAQALERCLCCLIPRIGEMSKTFFHCGNGMDFSTARRLIRRVY